MGRRKENGLTDKQERFIAEYMIDLNATQACIRTGYNKSMASYLMSQPKIKERIKELQKQIESSQLVSVEYILSGLTEVVDRCLQKKPLMVWDDIKHCRVQAKSDSGQLVFQFDSSGACKALELLGRYIGLFGKDNFQRTNPVNNKAELTTDQFNKLIDAAIKGLEVEF